MNTSSGTRGATCWRAYLSEGAPRRGVNGYGRVPCDMREPDPPQRTTNTMVLS